MTHDNLLPEIELAEKIATVVLNDASRDPDDDLSVMSRQFLRALEYRNTRVSAPVNLPDVVSAENWLKENCKADDWSKLEDLLSDSLWTNNVIQYMEGYAAALLSQAKAEKRGLVSAAKFAVTVLDNLLGDTDLPDDGREEFLACQRLNQALAAEGEG